MLLITVPGVRIVTKYAWQASLTSDRALRSKRAWLPLPAFAALPIAKRKQKQDPARQYYQTIGLLKGHMAFENPDITDTEALNYLLARLPHLHPDDPTPVLGYPIRENIAAELEEYRQERMSNPNPSAEDLELDRRDEEFFQRHQGKLAIDFTTPEIAPAEIAAVDYLLENEAAILERVLAALLSHIVERSGKKFAKPPTFDYVSSRYACLRILSLDRAEDGCGYLQFAFAIPDDEEDTLLHVTLHRDEVVPTTNASPAQSSSDSLTWTHPEMGTFSQANKWHKTIVLPEYAAFKYLDDRRNDEIEFALLVEYDPAAADKPTSPALEVLDDFWRNRPTPRDICDYLWADFNDEWKSGNWWCYEDDWPPNTPRPASADELLERLRLHQVSTVYIPAVTADPPQDTMLNPFTGEVIKIEPEEKGPPRPGFWAVHLSLSADFEEEHGVALLWHRGRFIGSGYVSDEIEPFKNYHPDK